MYGTATDMAPLRSRRPRRASRGLLRRGIVGTAFLAVLVGVGFAHAVQGSAPTGYEVVRVAPGDTLWDLAARRYPNADVRQKVDEIERANGLDEAGAVIHPGDTLRVPSS